MEDKEKYGNPEQDDRSDLLDILLDREISLGKNSVNEPAMAYGNGTGLESRDMIALTRKGLPFPKFKRAMQEIDLTNNEWATIIDVNPRTFTRIKTEKKTLDKNQTEKVLHLVMLYDKGLNTLGSRDKFLKWIDRNSIALGGISPKSLLDTTTGIQTVARELGRIEHGIFA